ncbi:MAG: cytochrome b [Pseudomonadota bacterium]
MIERLRTWARKHTEQDRYSPVGIAFHWIMALLVLFQLGWGWWTGWLHPGGDKLQAYEVHSAAGLLILVLAVLRAIWRLIIPGPTNDADRLGWQTQAAHFTHYLFYLCFFGLPLSGWAMWSSVAAPGPLYVAGIVPWPQMPFEELPFAMRWAILDIAEDVHQALVLLLMVLVPAHVGAALKHHFWDRHDVLRGMLPEVPDAVDPRGAWTHRPREPQLPTS